MSEAEQRVARGAAYLDEEKADWVSLVDLNLLDMARGDVCIAGQVFAQEAEATWRIQNGFHYLETEHGLSWTREHGFFEASEALNLDLQVAWMRLITQRQLVIA